MAPCRILRGAGEPGEVREPYRRYLLPWYQCARERPGFEPGAMRALAARFEADLHAFGAGVPGE